MSLLLGCIADDSTGATDLANNLVRAGMRVVQSIGVPGAPLADDVDAVVVALKSRSVPARAAAAMSLAALASLRRATSARSPTPSPTGSTPVSSWPVPRTRRTAGSSATER